MKPIRSDPVEKRDLIGKDYSLLYESIADNSDLLICRWNSDTTLTFVNRAYAEFYGMERDQLLGKQWIDLAEKGSCNELEKTLHKRAEVEHPFQREDPVLAADGAVHWIHWYNQPVHDTAGKLIEYQSVGIDVTEQKKARRRIIESEQTLQLILDNIDEIVAYHKPDLSIVWANKAFRERVAVDKESLQGSMCYHLWYGKQNPCDDCPVLKAVREKKTVVEEIEQNGIIWHIKAYPIFDDSGNLLGVVDLAYDKTRELEIYSRLREREEKYRAIVESTDDIIFELDRESRLTAIFGAWIENSEVNTDFFIGKTAAEIFPEGIAEVHMMNSEIALSGEQTTYEWSFGEEVNQKHYSINLSPIFDEEGLVTGLVGIGRDITKLKETEEALRRSRDDLLLTMSRLLKVKDPYTVDHQRKVERISTAIAERLKLPNEKIEALRIAAIVHDIGKLSIPADILNKPGRLNEIEWALIKNHPDEGFKILKEIHFGLPVAEIVRQHHERIDGSGYPRGLKDGEIMLEARILAVADVVEAVSSHRPYRRALGLEIALEEIKSGVGTKYDEEAVKGCLELFSSGFVPD